MTDPSLHRPSLRRRSASESDTDLMTSASNPRIYPNRFIPPGELNPNPMFLKGVLLLNLREDFKPGRLELLKFLKDLKG